ncbi:MAG: S8 family peptidase [Paludibacteraceae bacterium]
MRKIVFFVCFAGFALASLAQSALDIGSRMALRHLRASSSVEVDRATGKLRTVRRASADKYVCAMLSLDECASLDSLSAAGVVVHAQRGRVAVVSLPLSAVERVAAFEGVRRLSLSREVQPKNDVVRQLIGVDKIHAGEELPSAYTGRGVVTGIVDGGLDPNHINFRNADGTSRIQFLSHIVYSETSSLGYVEKDYTPDNIAKFTTDDEESFHGTHTLGTMAGGYRGTAQTAQKKNEFAATVADMDCPFYGMAYESDIVASCGTLQDGFIALGIENILNYRYDHNQPAVINLSLGSNLGSHDGKSMLGQYLALAGEEAIICVAAGNEGDLPIALSKTFTEGDTVLQTFIYPRVAVGSYQNLRYGGIDVYGNDTTPFLLKTVIVNKQRPFADPTILVPIGENTENVPLYIASPDYIESSDDKTNSIFTKAFNGYVGAGSDIDDDAQRYYCKMDFFTFDNTQTNAAGNYILGFQVVGKPGQRIDCYIDGAFNHFDAYDLEEYGWSDGSCNGSISDMACGDNILVVGSYNSRDSWGSLDGGIYGYQGAFAGNDVTSFTSFGTLIDGRNLPHVCAPGAAVVSSSSSYYASFENLQPNALQAKYVESNRTNIWHQSLGTSMATPVVTGAIALWLEADPTLTIDDVKDIIATTSQVDADVLGTSGNPLQWGAGKFDAYAGLKEVIRRASTGLESVPERLNRLLIASPDARHFNLFLGGATHINAVVYNTVGQVVMTAESSNDELHLDASSLSAGVYVVRVNGTHAQSIVVQ